MINEPLAQAINVALREEINRVSEEQIKVAQREIEIRIRRRTAEICAQVSSWYDYKKMGDSVVITVRFPDPNTETIKQD